MRSSLRRDPGTALKIGAVDKMKHTEDGAMTIEERAAISLQRAWKERLQYIYMKAIKQQKLCRDRREEMRQGLEIDCEPCASSEKKSADIKIRYLKKTWRDTDRLLFEGMPMIQMYDRGDNWNERWQDALSLPNKTAMDKRHRKSSLNAVYADFVHTARTYGRTIISEYFLHEYMKSVRPKKLGGVAGGKKYLWRGILFKLADGSKGPYGGSDEAAAKAAGHELRGASEYLETGVGLSVPPMCLLDYKGFRMLAQAELPIDGNTQKMGTNDGGHTVLNDSPKLNKRTAKAARKLGLRAHKVGGLLKRVRYVDDLTGQMNETMRNVGGKMLYAAADIEGHKGLDGRLYLIDLARVFPPEDPSVTPHLSGMLSVSAKVVKQNGQKGESATVTKAHGTLLDYDILYPDGREERDIPVHLLRDLRLFVFYRLMRPEFVRDRGRQVLREAGISPDHKFPKIAISNPMKFAIECAKSSSPKTLSLTPEESKIKHRYTTAAPDTMPSVAERPDLSQASTDPATTSAAYETFGGGGESTVPYESSEAALGEGSGDPLAAGGNRSSPQVYGCPSDAAWKRKAMECGIEFVVREDEYYKGFERFEVEADEEEMRRRGGAGYRPFDPETEPEPDDDPLPEYDGIIEEPDPVADRAVGGLVPNGRMGNGAGYGAFGGGGVINKSGFGRRLEFPSGGGFHGPTSVQPAPDSLYGEGSEAEDASDGYSARDDDYGGFDSESNASSMLSVSGSGVLRASRFNSTSSTYRKIVPSLEGSPNPGRRLRDQSATSDVRPYDRFSARSLVSRSSRGNSPRGGHRGFLDYQASLRLGMEVREQSGSSAAGLVSGYDIFKNSSTGSAFDVAEDGPNGTIGALSDGYSRFEPHARNPSNRSLFSPLGRGSPSHGSFLLAYQGVGEPPVGFSARGRHPRPSTRASKQRGADLGDRTGSHMYSEPFAHQTRDEVDFLAGVHDLPPPNQGAYDHFHAESNRTLKSDFNSAKSLGGETPLAPLAPPPAPSSHAPSLQQRPSQALNAVDPPPYSEEAAARRGVFVPAEPLGDPGEVEVMLDGEDAVDSPVPLSPDALTAFAAKDPEAKERNREVIEATQFLLQVVVPSTAKLLCMMPAEDLAKVNLASELHRCGVNMRHIGLLRAYVPHVFKDSDAIKMSLVTCRKGSGSGEGLFSSGSAVDGRRSGRRVGSGREWYAGKSSATILRDRTLVEVVVRTLKLVLREFQRRWMKSEQSSSEQGMHLLVSQFLNLVTGSHKNSEVFWRENVTTGVCQRFGTVALTETERASLWDVCSERPELLYIILKELVEVTGIRFKETVRRKVLGKRKKLKGFEFDLTSIRDIDPVVTPMAVFEGVIAQNPIPHSSPVEVNGEY